MFCSATSRVISVWALIISLETVQGLIRVLFVGPRIGDFAARQIAVFSGSLMVLLVAAVFSHWMDLTTRRARFLAGAAWVAMTVAFEISVGLVSGASWKRIFSDYDLAHGGLLPIGLLLMFLAPSIGAQLNRRLTALGPRS